MTKGQFKSMMREYRASLKKALWSSDSYAKACAANRMAEKCLRPQYKPVVSRAVMLRKFERGGLQAIAHIDSVKIRYK